MIKRRYIFSAVVFFISLLLSGCDAVLLNPKGPVGAAENHLIITAVLIMLLIVIPVILMTLFVAWKYRDSNTKARYEPTWTHSTMIEIFCWGIPCVIIFVLGILTWITSHTLDPYKRLNPEAKPVVIQVVALEWKWLFIYPEEKIATVNTVVFPVNREVAFYLTADAPMNAFQIPQLGSQIYAMAGMQTQLHLLADTIGNYDGNSVNYSGAGFSDMKFVAHAVSQSDFDAWVESVRHSPQTLTLSAYNQLALPSENNSIAYYSLVDDNLFENIIMKFMMPMPLQVMPSVPTQAAHSH